jgi:hypothetical protein
LYIESSINTDERGRREWWRNCVDTLDTYKYVVLINDRPALFAKTINNSKDKNDELSVSKHFGYDRDASTKNINDNDSEGGYKYRGNKNIRVRYAASWMMDAMETSDDIQGRSDCFVWCYLYLILHLTNLFTTAESIEEKSLQIYIERINNDQRSRGSNR